MQFLKQFNQRGFGIGIFDLTAEPLQQSAT